ncbi:anti-sigma factor family protein [Actinomadura terrae]|uniref:anti-sigma factor family protein n=1 Tax=Actinomadura terrae TaxID=604353 RepID=UPI001FA6F714|nr:zf-HC2 domain-containing protein [Actinomadura terrae]
MSCLGERLTALVDGELGHEERDRALAHLASCARCRAEADELRQIKGRLRGLSRLPASDGADDLPTDDFLTRLRSLAAPADATGPGGPTGSTGPDDPSRTRPERPAALGSQSTRPMRPPTRAARPGRPRDNRPGGRATATAGSGGATAGALRRHPRRYLVVGAATLFIGLGAASYAAGGRQEAPAVTPAFDRFAVEHALTSGDTPMTDPLTDPVDQIQTSPGP